MKNGSKKTKVFSVDAFRNHKAGRYIESVWYIDIFFISNTVWSNTVNISGGQSTQIKYLSKSTDTYTKILLQ